MENILQISPKMWQEVGAQLIRRTESEEIEDIIQSLPVNKSPGLDGLPYEVYKTLLNHIKVDKMLCMVFKL